MTTSTMPALAGVHPKLLAWAASPWSWCIAATAFIVFRDIAPDLADLRQSLGDTDDATRLVQVRSLLGGSGWFDTTLHRIGFPDALVSHWSRLIDLPLALLLALFGLVLSAPAAEMAVRILWPALLLLVFLRLMAREAELRGGSTAAALFVVLAVTCLSGLFQFRAGRIDHHNAMILGTVVGLLAVIRALEAPRVGWFAGAMLGLALAVGYEPLALTLPMIAAAALVATFEPRFLPGVRSAAVAMATALLCSFLITVPPPRWATAVCDSLAINMVLLVGFGAATLIVIEAHADRWRLAARVGALFAGGLLAAGAYLAAGPACIGGPFAAVSADAHRLWLSHVIETKSVFASLSSNPTPMIVFSIFVLAGIAAAVLQWQRERSVSSLALLVVVAGSLLPSLWQVKFIPYASWLAAFALAIAIAGTGPLGTLSALSVRLCGLMAVNQSSLALLAAPLLLLAGTSRDVVEGKGTPDTDACRSTPAVAALASLPKGRIVSQVDIGPFIAALTPHTVFSAPYHRLDAAIVETHEIFRAPPEESRRRLERTGATYLVACIAPLKDGRQVIVEEGLTPGSMHDRIARGEKLSFLEEISGASTAPSLRVWRIVPAVR